MFLKVGSLFEEGSRKHVKDMKHHIVTSEETVEERRIESRDATDESVRRAETREEGPSNRGRDQAREYYEQRTRVTKVIALDDLFKRRSLKAGDLESEARRVLIYGNPGSGKTCITKVIAHKWALGEMAREFSAVYVVPVRVLNGAESTGHQLTSLERAISQICFSKRKRPSEYEELVHQIEVELDDPSTLLVIDGLDEADDHAREIVSTIWERSCMVLVLSRPYNMRNIETRVGMQVECLGFNDDQLQDFIESELTEGEATRLVASLQQSPAMWEMAHIPVTAHILCSLSRDHGTATEERGRRVSIFQIYNDITNYVWKRFKEKPTARNIKRCDLFDDLERIAFEALRIGRILIPQRLVTQYATSTDAAGTFKESGLLLLVLEGQQYQFPHLTFQEYFAGRYIARNMRRKGSDEETRVLDFIQEEKYNQKHALTLSFAMHANAQGRNKNALHEMLSVVNDEPIEILGIQHFLLTMQVLEASLEEAEKSDLKTLVKDEEAIRIANGARKLLDCTMDNVLVRQVVVGKLEKYNRVLEEYPTILDDIADEAKHLLASSDRFTWKTEEKIRNVLKLSKNSPKHMEEIKQLLLQLVNEIVEVCGAGECMRRVECIVTEVPQLACDLLSMLARGCDDKDSSVREKAMVVVGRVVESAPQFSGDLLPMLERGCFDEDREVSIMAIEAVGCVVESAPQLSGDLLLILKRGCFDEVSSVRQKAMVAVGRVVESAPQLAGDLLPMLERGCSDGDSVVREKAMVVVGRVVESAPQFSGDLLPMLERGCFDEDREVSIMAIEAVGCVVESAPQLSGDLLLILKRGCFDEVSSVRQKAMVAVGRVVESAPQLAGDLLPMLERGCSDGDSVVREQAMVAVERVLESAPQLAGDLLPMLVRGCGDEDWEVSIMAMQAVEWALESAPQLVSDLLPMLVRGSGDEDSRVRGDAMVGVEGVLESAPQLSGDIIPMLVRGCSDEDRWIRQVAVQTVRWIVELAPQLADDLLPMLVRRSGDEDSWEVRAETVRTVRWIVESAPHLANEILPMLERGCSDGDSWIRRVAVQTVRWIVESAPHLANDLLPMLERGCSDGDSSVRGDAIEAVGRAFKSAPHLANEILPMLVRGSGDEDSRVRGDAMVGFEGVLESAPQLSGDLIPMLVRGCSDRDLRVRRVALTSVSRVVESAPHLANDLLPMLVRGCNHNNSFVRLNAIENVGRVLESAPQLAGDLIPLLERGCFDIDSFVRLNAIKAVGRVVESAPQLSGDLLPMLVMSCSDEDFDVGRTAITTLDEMNLKVVIPSAISISFTHKTDFFVIFVRNIFTLLPVKDEKLSLVLHSIISEEIGTWNKEDFVGFFQHLSKEVCLSFPGLIGYY